MSTVVKVLSKRSWDHIKKFNITDSNGNVYSLGYNNLRELEKDWKKFFDASIYFKPRAHYRAFLHNYTDMQSSFKQQLAIYNSKTKKTRTFVGLKRCSEAIKKYMAIA